MKREMTIEEALKHAAPLIESADRWVPDWEAPGVHNRIRQTMPTYWIATGRGKHRRGWCTFCGTWSGVSEVYAASNGADALRGNDRESCGLEPPVWPVWPANLKARQARRAGTKLGQIMVCPHCWRTSIVKQFASGVSRTADARRLMTFCRSPLDDGMFVCVEFSALQDLGLLDPEDLSTDSIVSHVADSIWIIEPATGGMWKFTRSTWIAQSGYCSLFGMYPGEIDIGKWREIKNVKATSAHPSTYGYVDEEAFVSMLEGTRLAWLTDVPIDRADEPLTFLINATRRPQIEYMHKRGWKSMAAECLGSDECVPLSWRAKTYPKFLRITPTAWQRIQSAGITPTFELIRVLQLGTRSPALDCGSIAAAEYLACAGRGYQLDRMTTYIVEMGLQLKPIARYLMSRKIDPGNYVDYIGQLRELNVPIDKQVLYPTDFDHMHHEMSMRMRARMTKDGDKHLAKWLKKYGEMYSWQAGGFIMRMVPSILALIEEGNEMHHCVGSYADAYASGRTVICTLRRVSAPDEPLYTVEIRPGTVEIVQCRGHYNDRGQEWEARRAADQPELDAFFVSLREHVARIWATGHDILGDGSKAAEEEKQNEQASDGQKEEVA
ncbi:MAG: PcfJ domain-containing protein [Clostridia bacterium]|nr:PcfJ domain-containing protein [Clostridia bacterium]